ncbi:MAG: SDR family NAD(P)-dependent oxidoreductase [Motiliproteus sp.]|nr:SDR family NAD(P)-dependent oxidoreductase [Motiliproteus sp.]MCW9052095.1 SDR family NAD(P)-dependent oxidoreductase [Motiliproteus sp.]
MNNFQYSKEPPWPSVWITGAGRGIGAALAAEMCRMGVTVYASSRSESQLYQLQQQLQDLPGTFIPAPLDIRDRVEIENLVNSWLDRDCFPLMTVLNAGTHDPFPAQEFCAERCRTLLESNLQGTLNCLHPVLHHYQQINQGHIAIMASVAGYRGLPTAAAYGASKAALINLCEALYLDLKDTDIKLQVVNPGFVKTPLTDKNEFKMPGLIEATEAAEAIIAGLKSNRFEICFPRSFVYFLKLLRVLPYSYYFKLTSKIKSPKQAPIGS